MSVARQKNRDLLRRVLLGAVVPIAVVAVGLTLMRSLATWQYESLVELATAETDVQALTNVQDGMAGTFVMVIVSGIALFAATLLAMTFSRSRVLAGGIGIIGVAACWMLIVQHAGSIDSIPYLDAADVGGPVTGMLKASVAAPIACAIGGYFAGAYLARQAMQREREKRRFDEGILEAQPDSGAVGSSAEETEASGTEGAVYRGERRAIPCRRCGATNAPGNSSCIRCGTVLDPAGG